MLTRIIEVMLLVGAKYETDLVRASQPKSFGGDVLAIVDFMIPFAAALIFGLLLMTIAVECVKVIGSVVEHRQMPSCSTDQ
jgi:hypothetical protein